jgi:hypothetical protein
LTEVVQLLGNREYPNGEGYAPFASTISWTA